MARRIRSSRLNRYAEKQNKKQFLIFGIGTIIIIFLLVQFSGVLLNTFGNIVFSIRGDEEQSNQTNQYDEVLFAPNIDSIPEATPSAQIDVSGSTDYEEGRIFLYVNDREVDSVNINKTRKFTFRNVNLKNGENTIKAYYSLDSKQSDFSQEQTVIRSSEKPSLDIFSPSDGTTFKKADKRINVSGKTDPDNTVTVNSFRAVVDSKGEFSYFLELNEGDNKITIQATNQAGTSESKELTVKYED